MASSHLSLLFPVNPDDDPYVDHLIEMMISDWVNISGTLEFSSSFCYSTDYTGSKHFRSSVAIEGCLCDRPGSGECLQSTQFFAKLTPLKGVNANNPHRKMLVLFFKREMLTYQTVVKTLHELQPVEYAKLTRTPFSTYNNLFPRCIGSWPEQPEQYEFGVKAFLLFENIKGPFHYIDALTGFTAAGARVVMKKLAFFHAAALSCKRQRPEKYAPLAEIVDSIKMEPTYTSRDVKNIMRRVKKHPELTQHSAQILAALNKSQEAAGTEELNKDWVGMCHGQLCVFNLMARCNEFGNIIDIKMLDLRHLKHQHIMSDVVYFLMTSLAEGVLKADINNILSTYLVTLWRELAMYQMDWTSFTYDILKQQVYRMFHRELLHCVSQLKFFAPLPEAIDELRTLSAWHPCPDGHVVNKVHKPTYNELLKRLCLTVIETNEFQTIFD